METTLNALTNVGTIFDLGSESGSPEVVEGSATMIDTIRFVAHQREDVDIFYTPYGSPDSPNGSKTGRPDFLTVKYDDASSSKIGLSTTSSQTYLYQIDRAQFTDTSVAFDLDVSENAGSALALYNAGFNELPSPRIFGQWIAKSDEIDSANDSKAGSIKDDVDMTTLAQSMIDTYAPGLSNEVLVAVLFKNVLGKEATTEELALSNLIDNGTFTQGEFFALAARQEQNTIEITGTTTGMAYTEDSKIG